MKNERLKLGKSLCGLMVLFAALAVGCAAEQNAMQANTAGTEEGDTSVAEEYIPVLDLTEYVSEDALYGDDNLKLQVNSDVVSALNEGQVWQVPFFFRSSVWHGNPWDHPSLLYIPSELNPAYEGTIAVIQQVTLDLNPGQDQDAQFGLETALQLGIPVAVLAKVPHPTLLSSVESESLSTAFPDCFETFLVEDGLAECARKLTWEDGRDSFNWALETPIMKAYARAITAVTNVPQTLQSFDPPLEGVPSFTVKNVIVGGAGKRARALWMLASIDARIKGIWIAGEDRGNLKEFYANMAASWDTGYTGVGPNDALSFLQSEFGTTWEYWQDPYRYMEGLSDVSVFLSRGTNDPFSPLSSYRFYEEALPSHQLLYVPNAGFGMGTPAQVASWRALIHQVANGTEMHRVDLSVVRNGGTLSVSVEAPKLAAGPLASVEIFRVAGHSSQDDTDLRDAFWEPVSLAYQGETFDGKQRHTTEIPKPGIEHWAIFAQVSFTDGNGVDQVVSSPVWFSWLD